MVWGSKDGSSQSSCCSQSEHSFVKGSSTHTSSASSVSGLSVTQEQESGDGHAGRQSLSGESGADDEYVNVLKRAGMWSVGSIHHVEGKCRPCHYIYSRSGCELKGGCTFCHLPHTDGCGQRLGMFKRVYCKNFVHAVYDACAGDATKVEEVIGCSSSKSWYLRSVMSEVIENAKNGGELSSDSLAAAVRPNNEQGVGSQELSPSAGPAAAGQVPCAARSAIKSL